MTTNTVFQLRRNAVSGTRPTTTTVAPGELAINTTDGILFSANSTAIFEIGANVTTIAVGNSTVRQTANSTGIYANGSVNLIRNDTRLTFTPVAGGANVYFIQQSDDNFVFYTTNTTGGSKAVFNVYANTNSPNQNSAIRFNVPIDMGSQGIYANNSLGTAGQVLTSSGTSVYWAAAAAGVNTAATFAWTNTHTFAANLTILGTSELIIANGAGIQANGTFGTTGQVLSSNGTGVYWDTGLTASSTATLTNKRIDPRVSSTASAASVTPDISSFDMYIYTALAAGLTINATTGGSPVNGSKLTFRFKDNGTARNLTWTTSGANSFRAIGVTLPTATVINKVTYVGCIYNSDESFWDVVAVVTQA